MNTQDPDTVLNLAVEAFRGLLCSHWRNMKELAIAAGTEIGEFRSDWAQANWEFIVESSLSPGQIFIEPYGEGADCNPVGSRVWQNGVASTHAVHIVPRSGASAWDFLSESDLTFPATGLMMDGFVAATLDGWFAEDDPFDRVLVQLDDQQYLFRVSDVRFVLQPVAAVERPGDK